ncbi:MAG TPA: DUF4157 domain-containing protein [Geobacteraceae bacterium]|nr:DUF4157 domain-containing protein [Geobacteraceae bacterium]
MTGKTIDREPGILSVYPKSSEKDTDRNIRGSAQSVRQPALFAACMAGRAEIAGVLPLFENAAVAADILRTLQRGPGNRYVQRLLACTSVNNGGFQVQPEVEDAIQSAKGSGRGLDGAARSIMEPVFGADFSNVRVHTGPQADSLNRTLSARAFTTGRDIFFRDGEYNPGSSSGRDLLAHELTHVVQQGEGIHGKFTVSRPGDEYEQEANHVAAAITRHLQRQEY